MDRTRNSNRAKLVATRYVSIQLYLGRLPNTQVSGLFSFHQFCYTPICVGEVIEVGDVTIEFLWFLVHIGYIWSFLVLTQTACKAPVQLAILIP